MSEMTLETSDIKDMTIDEKQRALYKMHAESVETEAKEIIAGCTTAEGCERAAAWRQKKAEYVKSIEGGVLGMAATLFRKKWEALRGEINSYTAPVKTWDPLVKAKMDKWYSEEKSRIALERAQKVKEEEAAALAARQAEIKNLKDLGKPDAAKAIAKRPLEYVPPTVPMPKIKNVVWKKQYFVQINDLPKLLRYIAKNEKYHAMIDQDFLIGKLENLARELAGNLTEFDGATCTQSDSSTRGGGK